MFQAPAVCVMDTGSDSMFSGGIFSAAALTSSELTSKVRDNVPASILTATTSTAMSNARVLADASRQPHHRRAFSDTWTILSGGYKLEERPNFEAAPTLVEVAHPFACEPNYACDLTFQITAPDRKFSYFMDLDDLPSPTELSCPAIVEVLPRRSEPGEKIDSTDFTSKVIHSDGQHASSFFELDFIDGEEIVSSSFRDLRAPEHKSRTVSETSASQLAEANSLLESNPQVVLKNNIRRTSSIGKRLNSKPRETRKGESLAGRAEHDLLMLDPKRVKRVMANRQAVQTAARSKEKKFQYMSELQGRMSGLQNKCEAIRGEVEALQQDNARISYHNQDLDAKLERLQGDVGRIVENNNHLVEELSALQLSLGIPQQLPRVTTSAGGEPPRAQAHIAAGDHHRLSSSGAASLAGQASPGPDFNMQEFPSFNQRSPQTMQIHTTNNMGTSFVPNSSMPAAVPQHVHMTSLSNQMPVPPSKPQHRRVVSSMDNLKGDLKGTGGAHKRTPSMDGTPSYQATLYCPPGHPKSGGSETLPSLRAQSFGCAPVPSSSSFHAGIPPVRPAAAEASHTSTDVTGYHQNDSYNPYLAPKGVLRAPNVVTTSVSGMPGNRVPPVGSLPQPYSTQQPPPHNCYPAGMIL